ncbi:potassium voltage-gated channel protein Shaker isoform X2 [Amblyomma americanum]
MHSHDPHQHLGQRRGCAQAQLRAPTPPKGQRRPPAVVPAKTEQRGCDGRLRRGALGRRRQPRVAPWRRRRRRQLRAHPARARPVRAGGDQREWAAVRDAAAHPAPVPGHLAWGPGTPAALLRPAAQRVLLRPQQAQLRRHPLLLPERRPPSATSERSPGRVRRGDQVLRAGRGHLQQIPRGRGLHQGGGETAAGTRPAATHLAALRIPGELAGCSRGGDRVRGGHPAVHRHLLPGDAARVQALPHVPRGQQHDARGRGRGAQADRAVLPHRDLLHRMVHVRAVRALLRLPLQTGLLQGRDEQHRPRGHHPLLHHPRHRNRPGARRARIPASGQELEPGHEPGHSSGHQAGARVSHLQVVAPLQGPADPGPNAPRLHAGARPAHLLPLHRSHPLLVSGLLRRGGLGPLLLQEHTGRVLVGRGDHDHGRLRRHASRGRLGQDRGLAVRHRRRADHRAARAGDRVQLQLLLPSGDRPGGDAVAELQPRHQLPLPARHRGGGQAERGHGLARRLGRPRVGRRRLAGALLQPPAAAGQQPRHGGGGLARDGRLTAARLHASRRGLDALSALQSSLAAPLAKGVELTHRGSPPLRSTLSLPRQSRARASGPCARGSHRAGVCAPPPSHASRPAKGAPEVALASPRGRGASRVGRSSRHCHDDGAFTRRSQRRCTAPAGRRTCLLVVRRHRRSSFSGPSRRSSRSRGEATGFRGSAFLSLKSTCAGDGAYGRVVFFARGSVFPRCRNLSSVRLSHGCLSLLFSLLVFLNF